MLGVVFKFGQLPFHQDSIPLWTCQHPLLRISFVKYGKAVSGFAL
jgi:hypothetical protein